MIRLHDKQFAPFISASEIDLVIQRLALQVELDYSDQIPVFIGVLNGSFMFVSDFMKQYKKPCELSFVKLASYQGTTSSQEVKQLIGLNQDLAGRDVIILEDIVDTGNTLVELKTLFDQQNIKSLKIASLFYKPDVYNKDIKIDYIGLSIPNKFIVGFGLDYNELGRNLPKVYQLEN